MENPQSSLGTDKLKVFVPNARNLTAEEVANIPEQGKEHIKETRNGVWLEVNCPDRDCVIEEGKIALHVICARDKESESLWMRLFCPEDRCFANQPTNVVS